jgi:hypothetical protein
VGEYGKANDEHSREQDKNDSDIPTSAEEQKLEDLSDLKTDVENIKDSVDESVAATISSLDNIKDAVMEIINSI